MEIKKLKDMGDGIKVSATRNNGNDYTCYIIKDDFYENRYWNSGDAYLKVTLPISYYDGIDFIIKGNINDEQSAFDTVVDFATEMDIPIMSCDFYQAQDEDMVNENGDVIGHMCVGNDCIYIPDTANCEELFKGNFVEFMNWIIKEV